MNKYINNFELLLIIPIIILTLIKFFNILQVPIFLDEALYLSQAEKVTEDIHNLFIAFQGTQFPIMTWITETSGMSRGYRTPNRRQRSYHVLSTRRTAPLRQTSKSPGLRRRR